jgi:hypothetical protein
VAEVRAEVVAARKDLRGTGSLLSVAALFAVNGLLLGGIGGTLPAMGARLGVDAGGLGVLLVSLSVAAVVSMQIGAGWLTALAHTRWCYRRAPC